MANPLKIYGKLEGVQGELFVVKKTSMMIEKLHD